MAGTALKPIDEVRGAITAMAPEFLRALPSHISVDKFQRVAITSINSNPDLVDANTDRRSLYAACMKAAQDGLLPDGSEAAFVKYGNKVQYLPMIGGVLKKIRQSGQVSVVDAISVHKNDKFSYKPAIHDLPDHEPDWFGDRGEWIGVYAFAKLKDGTTAVRVFNKNQIEQRRAVSKSKDGPAWKNWYEEQAQKTVLHNLAKRLPKSTDIEQIISSINDDYDLQTGEVVEQPPTQEPGPQQAPRRRGRPSGLQTAVDKSNADTGGPASGTGPVIDHEPHQADDGGQHDNDAPPI